MRTFPEGRRCVKCGKPLSVYNGSNTCFSCQEVFVLGFDTKRRRPRMEKADPRFVVINETVCSSRVTRGFNRAYLDYHGCPAD